MDSKEKKRRIKEMYEQRKNNEEAEEEGDFRGLGFLDARSRTEVFRIATIQGSIRGTKTTYLRRR